MAQRQKLREIPQPEPKFLIDNLIDVSGRMSIADLVKLAQEYGPIYQLARPSGLEVVLSGFSLVDEVCDDRRFDKDLGPELEKIRDFAGDGLFTAWTFEPDWGKAHRILLPSFSLKAMQGFMPMMNDVADQLIQKWERLNPDDVIDVVGDMTRLTLDTIGLCGFDYRFNSFYREEPHPFVQSLVGALSLASQMLTPTASSDPLQAARNQQYQQDIDSMNGLVDNIIANRKNASQAESPPNDLLTAMLHGVDRQAGEGLSDQNIRYQIITFMIAGHETTSSLLSWAIYFLLRNPPILARATEEVDRVLGRDPRIRPTYQQFHQLAFVEQILKEALRLAPPVVFFRRHPYQDTVIGGRYGIAKGQMLRVLTPLLHRDPVVWGEEADRFDPDRFTPEAEAARAANAYKPFGTGQRACIGRQFALQEATLALGRILQRFTLVDYAHYQPQIQEVGAIKPANFTIKVEKRTIETGPVTIAERPEPAPAAANAPTGVRVAHGTPLLVLYGSNTGTSEELARRIGDDGEANGFATVVAPLDDFARRLPTSGLVVIVTASYNGTPPDNAAAFCAWLQSGELSSEALRGVRYVVFGCGNHEWAATYQAIPRLVDDSLAAFGAERLYPRGEGDAAENLFDSFDEWYRGLRRRVAEIFLPGLQLPAASARDTLYTIEILTAHAMHPLALTYDALLAEPIRTMTVEENRELVQPAVKGHSERSTKHIEIGLPAGVTYQTGDHLGVLPFNNPELIRRVTDRFGIDGDAWIRLHSTASGTSFLPLNTPIRVSTLLEAFVELQLVATREQIGVLAANTPCPPERERLAALTGDDVNSRAAFKEQVTDRRASLLDLLEEFPACELPFVSFLGMLPRLSPRYYSISSSPLVAAERCSITVRVVEEPARSGHGTYHGVGSTYLATRRRGDGVFVFVRKPSSNFRLPNDSGTPLIMVGPGTGVAPFRAFLQERAVQKSRGLAIGPSMLFFGCHDPNLDFLYREELEQYVQQGVTQLFTAFSRVAGRPKTYVQDRIRENQAAVWAMIEAGAIIYVCGDAGRMAPEVQQTFAEVYRKQLGKTTSEADRWMADLIADQRYRIDVWGSG